MFTAKLPIIILWGLKCVEVKTALNRILQDHSFEFTLQCLLYGVYVLML